MSGAFPSTFTTTFPGGTTTTGSGWEQLAAILDQARQAAETEANTPPTACPRDGTPLDDVDGIKHCPFDGWVDSPLPPNR